MNLKVKNPYNDEVYSFVGDASFKKGFIDYMLASGYVEEDALEAWEFVTSRSDVVYLSNDYPPIPIRDWDCGAYRDPEGLSGHGRTKEKALYDLFVLEYENEFEES